VRSLKDGVKLAGSWSVLIAEDQDLEWESPAFQEGAFMMAVQTGILFYRSL
jgi:hypothetical protein